MILPLILVTLASPVQPLPVLQAAPRIHISPTGKKSLGYNWDGKNINGEVHGVPVFITHLKWTNPALPEESIDVVYISPTEIPPDDSLFKIPMTEALRGVTSGDWDCQVALEDVAGLKSPYTSVTDQQRFTVTVNPPSAPKNVGVVDS